MSQKLNISTTIISFLKLIRAANLLILVLAQYMVAIFLIGPVGFWKNNLLDFGMCCVALSTLLAAAAGYIINDYYDIKIDIVNKPERVVIGRLLTRRLAMTIHTLLNLSAIIIGFLAGWKISAMVFITAFLLWLYSNSLKRLPLVGNLMVSFLTSLSIILVAIYFDRNIQLVFTYALFAFFISVIREVIKDMEDVKGDAAFGCNTLPIAWGIRKTKLFIYFLLPIFLISLLFLGIQMNKYLIIYFLTLILPSVGFLLFKLIRSDSSKDFRFLSRLCKFIMISGILSMLLI